MHNTLKANAPSQAEFHFLIMILFQGKALKSHINGCALQPENQK